MKKEKTDALLEIKIHCIALYTTAYMQYQDVRRRRKKERKDRGENGFTCGGFQCNWHTHSI